MNLVRRYLSRGIEGMNYQEFRSILRGDSALKVTKSGNGLVMLTNKKMIRCVSHYYQHPQNKILVKASNECFYVQKALEVNGISTNNCASCHMRCMDLRDQKIINRK